MRRPLSLLIFVSALPAPGWAGQGLESARAPGVDPSRREVAALRIGDAERVILDGRLDEDFWSRAVPATNFVQQDPANGQPATEQTEVRIVYNGDSLFMGVTCFDSDPEGWLGYQRRRDEFLSADDRFQWVIDTYLDARSSYFFETNPSGLMADALRGTGTNNRQWDGIWNEKVRRSEIGWTIEIEIPFRTLNFDPASDRWGINFQRTIRRKNEETLWSGWARNQGLNRLTNAGLLTGLQGASQGRGIDFKPYGVSTWQTAPGRGDSSVTNDKGIGGDIAYSPTPRLRTTLTINTDFAQTEVDQRLTNLTRFPLFLQERRDFFLDGSTFFDFQSAGQGGGGGNFGGGGGGGGGNTLIPYFSRRIGLDANGDPQKIDVGGRVSGQVGTQDVGVLYVRTAEEVAGPGQAPVRGEDFLVLRAKRRILRQSYFGGLYTGRNVRDEGGVPTLHTMGADFLLATSTFRGNKNLSVGGFYLNTTNPADTGASAAFGANVDYPNDVWNATVSYREIQENYYAAVGFTPRVGFRRLNPALDFSPRPRNSRLVRRYSFGASVSQQNDTADNRLLNRDWDFRVFQMDLQSQDTFQVHVLPTYERLDRDFPISPGITLPKGNTYSVTRYQFQAQTADRRVVAVRPTVELGGFYSGTRRRLALDVTLRIRPGVIIYTSGEWNNVDLEEGSFETKLYRIVPELQFSPWISWVNNIQYDTQSAQLGWQSRFRWILKPGSDIYLVYTHNWLDDPVLNKFSTLDRRMASKILYTQRF